MFHRVVAAAQVVVTRYKLLFINYYTDEVQWVVNS
jgi:hypothetical protein